MRNIYLIQAGDVFGGNRPSAFLPYAVGCIAAYAWSNTEIKNNYCLKRIVYCFEARKALIDSLENPYMVAFSSYVWNHEYNLLIAKTIKQVFPACKIVFGGHQITKDTKTLESYPFIDYTIWSQGEYPFYLLLMFLLNKGKIENIPALSYRKGYESLMNDSVRIDTTDFPSPYLTGTFDELMKDPVDFIATLETVRGCPYGCAYCDCSLEDNTVFKFPEERIYKEIQWIADNKINVLFCADSNFGTNSRDEEIAAFMASCKKRCGYPVKIDVALSKEKNSSAFNTAKLLKEANMFHVVTMSVQSTSPKVLEAVGRKNIDESAFHESIISYTDAGIKPFTELIIGLPLETYDSFCDGFEKLILAGQRYYVEVYRCYLLVNARLSQPSFIQRYAIETVDAQPILHHVSISESNLPMGMSKIVVATSTMSRKDWIKANLFAITVQSFYYMGILKFIAEYLHEQGGFSFRAFFEKFMNWSLENKHTFSGKMYSEFERIFTNFAYDAKSMQYINTIFGNINWFTEEGLFLEAAYGLDSFFEDIELFMREYGLDGEVISQLIEYQKLMICLPFKKKQTVIFDYDFYGYFSSIEKNKSEPLRTTLNSITVTQKTTYLSWQQYAREVVWYQRKSGGTISNCVNSDIKIVFEGSNK